jgi:AcrR family transcriptional regulator
MTEWHLLPGEHDLGIMDRRKRERDLQQKMRRKQILYAAKRVFYAKGFSPATIEDIAQEAELSPAAIYLYFKNKDDLYASLNLQLLEYMHERLDGLRREKALNADEKLEALKDVLYDIYKFDPLIVINLFHLQASDGLKKLPSERSNQINELAGRCLRSLSRIFEQGIDEGRFIAHHPIALADIIWIVFTGAVLWEESKRMINPRKDYLRQTLELAIDILGRGIKAA